MAWYDPVLGKLY